MNNNIIQKYIYDEDVEQYKINGWFIGKLPVSKETCIKISIANKGKTAHNKGKPCSEEQKTKISKTKTGVKMSDEARKNNSNGHKGLPGTNTDKIVINNGIVEKFIKEADLQYYKQQNWVLGRKDSTKCASVLGKILINNGIINKYIFPSEFDEYNINGWIKGKAGTKSK